MRASDIVAAIQSKLPLLVDDFTTNASVTSIATSGFIAGITTVTVNTASEHGFKVNNRATLSGVTVPIAVTSIIRNGIVAIVTTTTDHDLTNGSQPTVNLSGANEAEFNGTFQFLDQSNRRTFRIIMVDSGPTIATGTLLGDNIGSAINAISGEQAISAVPTTTSFQYLLSIEVLEQPILDIAQAKGNPRISAAVSLEQFTDSYTAKLKGQAWLCVVLGDGIANKSRREDTDATTNLQRAQYFNSKINQTVEVYIYLPTVDSFSGSTERDRCEELLQPLCQCILLKTFSNLLTSTNPNPLQIIGHGAELFNKAFYVHRYSFEAVVQLLFGDTVGYDEDVALRNINGTQNMDTGNEPMTYEIDLDDTPL